MSSKFHRIWKTVILFFDNLNCVSEKKLKVSHSDATLLLPYGTKSENSSITCCYTGSYDYIY